MRLCKMEVEFCKMEVRLTLGRKNRFLDSSFPNGKCLMHNQLGGLFKEIPELISLNHISLTSILQNSTWRSDL
jgi:hypothetical protein